MAASVKLCVVLLILVVVPSHASLENGEVSNAKNKSNFKRLLRFFGIGTTDGNAIPPQFNQLQQFAGPCGIPLTTTPAPVGTLCPYPVNPPLPVPGGLVGPQPGPDSRPFNTIPPNGNNINNQNQPFFPNQPNFPNQPGNPNFPLNQPSFPNQAGNTNFPSNQPSFPNGNPNFPSNQPNFPNGNPNFPQNRPNLNPQNGFPNVPPNQPTFPGRFPNNPGKPVSSESLQGDGPFPNKPLGPILEPSKLPFNPIEVGHDGPFPFEPVSENVVKPMPFKPVQVDPTNPNLPNNPVLVDPARPILPPPPVLIDPTKPNPSQPVLIDPTNPIQPSQPVLIDPTTPNFPNQPLPVQPSHPGPLDPFRPVNPSYPNQPDFPRPLPDGSRPKPPFINYPNPPLPDNIGQGTSPGGVVVGPGPLKPIGPGPLKPPQQPKPVLPIPADEPERLRPMPCSAHMPFIPPGFSPASMSYFRTSQTKLESNEPPCSTLDTLSKLGAKIMHSLLMSSDYNLLLNTPGYTLFVPLDVAFKRMPKLFFNSLQTDENLRKAFLLNHLVREDVSLHKLGNEYLLINARPGANAIRVNVYFKHTEFPVYTADGAKVLRGDILTANGRIHLTDKVINPNPPRNAAEYLSERAEFESFWNLVKNSNLEALQSDYPITLFVPTNEAMERIEVKTVMKDPHQLKNFIDYHIVNGTYYSSGLLNGEYLTTNYNKEIKLGVTTDGFSKALHYINGYNHVLKSDIPLVNGVVHILERCISEKLHFYTFDESDEFQSEYGVISKRNMRITSEEKNIEQLF